jgi:hypothetical protein
LNNGELPSLEIYGANPNASGLAETGPASHTAGKTGNAPGNDQSGTWVRVADWLSGPNWGSHFLHRIGNEVMVDFQEGDIDRPVIVGQAYNGADLPPFSAGYEAGTNHPGVLSGWMSHNFDEGHNQWVADDAPGQLRTRLTPSAYWRHAARQRDPARLSPLARRDAFLMPHIERIWQTNFHVYGADKVWRQLQREGMQVARCAVDPAQELSGRRCPL